MTHKPTCRFFSVSAAVVLSTLFVAAFATSASAVTIPTVPVGNPGNTADPLTGNLYGGVAYAYRIGTTEVTNAQYAAFLNAKAASDPLGLYNPGMDSDPRGGITRSGSDGSYTYATKTNMSDKPVNYVSWYDAIRFANWLHNGQGSGDTETGAYTILGGTPTPSNGLSITRNVGATWFLTSEDEWYKAAYHQPAAQGGDADDYWLYPTRTNSTPYSDQPPGSDAPSQSNTANFLKNDSIANGYDDGYAVTGSPSWSASQNYLTDAGAYALSTSPYGTYDQGGNVSEWNEALIYGSYRSMRDGSWGSSSLILQASNGFFNAPAYEGNFIGFRVATVPEPGTAVLAIVGCVLMLWWSKRRKR